MTPKQETENVKPASTSIWDTLFRPRKTTSKPSPKKDTPEPSFLDDLDDFETNIDLPRCLVDPRR
jgi:hypothetical protein